jgi:DNA-binding XRE family transcriptional regulator
MPAGTGGDMPSRQFHELERLKAVEKAARELLPYLPRPDTHHVPSNNLRVALGVLPGFSERTLGKRVMFLRKRLGWSMERLAKEAGLSKTFIFSLEKDEQRPGIDAVISLARALGLTLDQLVFGGE